jgi:chemotaxis protein CheC
MELQEYQSDVLAEVMNLGMGHAANALNELVGAHIHLRVPSVSLATASEAQEQIAQLGWIPLSAVHMEFSGSLDGNVAMLFPEASAVKLVALLTGDEGGHDDVDGVRRATLEEAGNILLNGVVGAISNLLENQVEFSVPFYSESDRIVEQLTANSKDGWVLLSRAHFRVSGQQIEGEILLYFEIHSLEVLLATVDRQFALSNME